MDTQQAFNACYIKLREAGKSSEEAAQKCVRFVSESYNQTTAKLGNLSLKTTDKKQRWILFIVILLLIVVGTILLFKKWF